MGAKEWTMKAGGGPVSTIIGGPLARDGRSHRTVGERWHAALLLVTGPVRRWLGRRRAGFYYRQEALAHRAETDRIRAMNRRAQQGPWRP
jgi:hypothetical protein